MLSSNNNRLIKVSLAIIATLFLSTCNAFVVTPASLPSVTTTTVPSTTASYMAKKGKKAAEDLSYIESRDMTREEMLELNAKIGRAHVELQSHHDLVCRLLLEKKKYKNKKKKQ